MAQRAARSCRRSPICSCSIACACCSTRADELSLECPFWLEPENPFEGRQISENRWQLSFGGGGKASAIQQGDQQDFSAGGAGRLLFGRMFADGNGLYIGAELGGSAQFPKDEMGERTSLVLGADLMTPIVYRHTLLNTYWEVEAGWLGHATEQDWSEIDHGVHVGFAFGGRALRQRFLFPGCRTRDRATSGCSSPAKTSSRSSSVRASQFDLGSYDEQARALRVGSAAKRCGATTTPSGACRSTTTASTSSF